ncbi:aspartyl-phosphate phosphatase Spo0E family protein [Clostridium sp. AWRP]|uniref:aspartyl-phosphate phosphatase Spo0E family protein n=1 Tax=Clostridium sp. AWRP TaxID=2212991 RepID=UPI000FD84A6E|nr:aspartyl-phosphate phosphatase Spo0E family protein [Clostridium sp. AWRP]AZV56775.1 aspartyl-phosphate phosphatase Spo0E family protein [Clostridium sp. AWRP]
MTDFRKNKVNDLREKLDRYAYEHGTLDQKTLEISQEVDKFIVEDMKRILCKGFN